jgi:hypothetical protein
LISNAGSISGFHALSDESLLATAVGESLSGELLHALVADDLLQGEGTLNKSALHMDCDAEQGHCRNRNSFVFVDLSS